MNGNAITTLEGNVDGYSYNWAGTSTFKRKTRYLSDGTVYAFYRPRWSGTTSTSTSQTSKKSVDELAKEVIAGKWSAGEERKQKLTAAGYSYSAVQNRVNELLSGKTPQKSVDELAREVIAGKWGNGEERRKKLTAAGYNYSAVQNRVNELMR